VSFLDDLALSSLTVNGLHKAVDQVTKYCREWNLKISLKKIKIFKKAGKLKKDDRWTLNEQKTEVADEINYLGGALECSGGSNRRKHKTVTRGNQTLVATHRCLARLDVRVKISENVYEMLSESRTMYGREMWGLDGGWDETDQIHSRFCQIILGVARFAANSVAELELAGREGGEQF
jgi:hypothetical protein